MAGKVYVIDVTYGNSGKPAWRSPLYGNREDAEWDKKEMMERITTLSTRTFSAEIAKPGPIDYVDPIVRLGNDIVIDVSDLAAITIWVNGRTNCYYLKLHFSGGSTVDIAEQKYRVDCVKETQIIQDRLTAFRRWQNLH